MRRPSRWALVIATVLAAACGEPRQAAMPSGGAVDPASCTLCHGDKAAVDPAPPRGTHGETSTADAAVGAHQQHLRAGRLSGPIACSECHLVPTTFAHASQPLDLTWGALARADGAAPAFDPSRLTCANYCHGATMGGGSLKSPVWNKVDGTQAACGTCHGLPPPRPHPAVQGGLVGCSACHAGTVSSSGTIDVAGGLHVNGEVDLGGSGGDCTGCHGDPGRGPVALAPAPPLDTKGNSATSAAGVGAHQSHLAGGSIRGPLPCTSCHVIPTDVAHASQPLNLTWDALATAGGTVVATWNAGGLTCANYCHGATIGGGALTAPVWNKVDGSQAACGTCHGLPPPSPHPPVGSISGCAACHAGTVSSSGTIDVAAGLHVNGKVDFAGTATCTACHGDVTRTPVEISPAPPVGTHGETLTSQAAVGAHQSHLEGGTIRGPLPCTSCHVVPADVAHASQPLNLTWSALATANGAFTPSWNPTSLTCANYCHGATIGGGSLAAPAWNKVDGSQAACGTCHGLPPPSPHPPVGSIAACAGCHAGTVKTDGSIDVAGGLHVNGTVDLSGGAASCTACHGDATRTPVEISPAPPLGTHGETSTSQAAVGAHQSHLAGGSIRGPLPCTSCHVVPADLGHASQPLNLTWSALATADGAFTPTWNPTSLTCANYCHGATIGGGSLTSPIWNKVDGTQAACATCHGIPPPSPHPPASLSACAGCHPGTVRPDGSIIVAGGLHVNGQVDLDQSAACTACHGDASRLPADIAAAPPRDTQGSVSTTSPGVGAHQSHLARSNLRPTPIPCSECHVVPTGYQHAGQPLVLQWGPLATAYSTSPTWNGTASTCANWCHQAATPTWTGNFPATGTSLGCTSCHGTPPATGHHSTHTLAVIGVNVGCSCHPNATPANSNFNKALHLNGVKDLQTYWDPGTRTCTNMCHTPASPTW